MGRTLFMIHGMWGTPSVWENWSGWFSDRGWRCMTPALRYHDMHPEEEPDPRLGQVGLTDYVRDLEQEIRALPERPVVMGHSMGGLLAQKLAARGLARRAVLLTPAAPAGIMALRWSVVRSFLSYFARWGFWKKPHRITFAEASYSSLFLLDEQEQRRVYETFVYESGRAIFETGLWLLDRRRAAAVPEGPLPCPALVVAAGRDRIVPAPVVRKTAERYGESARYLELPHHAHWVHGEEGWQDICARVAAWLEDKSVGEEEDT
ncbi:MAG: alpha/beta hydrolase [bacterium]